MGRKLRLLMSAFAIVLGVSFVSGSLIFTDMLGSTFNGIMNGTVADVNVQPKGSSAGGATSGSRSVLTRAQIDRIGQVEGVRSSVGAITVTDAYLVGKNGKVLATEQDLPACDADGGLGQQTHDRLRRPAGHGRQERTDAPAGG